MKLHRGEDRTRDGNPHGAENELTNVLAIHLTLWDPYGMGEGYVLEGQSKTYG